MGLVLNNVSVIYHPKTRWETSALSGISLHLKKGETVALMGPSGSGKSTLLRLLTGLILPSAGETQGLKSGSRVVLSIQEPQRGFFAPTVWEEVGFGPDNLNLSSEEVEQRVVWALRAVYLPKGKWRLSPWRLSGGEQRRVALASVIAMRPDFLLLDEPTAGLDSPGRKQLTELLLGLREKYHFSLVIASHEPDFLFPLTKRILLLEKGRLALDTDWRKIAMKPETLTESGLELPTLLRVLRVLAQRGVPIDPCPTSFSQALLELNRFFDRKERRRLELEQG